MALATNDRKVRGAYFTPNYIAAWLCNWAIRGASEKVMDPSLGDGVFLEAAANHLKHLAAKPKRQIFGCELDPDSHRVAATTLAELFDVPATNLSCSDFFSLQPTPTSMVDVLLGNPPYIRYQRFSGESRRRALQAASVAGVKLNQLSSAWAPFLVHACEFLKPGGRMAMVVPFELTYANYARPVLDHLLSRFQSIEIRTFQQRIFQDISEDTVLLMAEGHGQPCERLEILGYQNATALGNGPAYISTVVDIEAWRSGGLRLSSALLPHETQELYLELSRHPNLARLGSFATIDIGYVSGNNSYFHLGEDALARFKIPPESLKPTIINSRDLAGLSYTQSDHSTNLTTGKPSWLFYPSQEDLGDAERAYVDFGEALGVQTAYKCRTRSPWWRVPFVSPSDAVLTVMSNLSPRMVFNDIGAVVANSLLTVRFKNNQARELNQRQVAAFYTSLTQLSAEIEGHGLGGGALKLEPGEAKQLLLPTGAVLGKIRQSLVDEIDRALRRGELDEAVALGDRYVLQDALGFTTAQVAEIKHGVLLLRNRRRGK